MSDMPNAGKHTTGDKRGKIRKRSYARENSYAKSRVV